jgi:hypothetical protein
VFLSLKHGELDNWNEYPALRHFIVEYALELIEAHRLPARFDFVNLPQGILTIIFTVLSKCVRLGHSVPRINCIFEPNAFDLTIPITRYHSSQSAKYDFKTYALLATREELIGRGIHVFVKDRESPVWQNPDPQYLLDLDSSPFIEFPSSSPSSMKGPLVTGSSDL